MTAVAYLGPKGTFTNVAVDALFEQGDTISYRTIPACLDAVDHGEVDVAVVPLENAIEGTVHLTIDYLIHQVDVSIIAEAVMPIEQHLLVHKDFTGDITSIDQIYSHSHAIAQCHHFIHEQIHEAEVEYTSSTGEAAAKIAQAQGNHAAIGNVLAAREYGLHIIRYNIHDYDNNHTRFAVVQKQPKPIKLRDLMATHHKTTLMVTLPSDYSGALHQVLSAFAWRKMNLSKIESRPMKTGLGNYYFIIDVEQPYDDILFPAVQAELAALGCQTKILGTYPCFPIVAPTSASSTKK
ncbi:prephenate dehydratase [Pontibacillus litoralis]|uniref:Prephenate dehydratase n=1 Tax=Pontibacillus litoralis JSM 072002 TaxID=1385512 RepID=A0A0A5GAI5_9BACI|nr:prephenate dehydratase [Pontibacillus litoralis]KGX89004.1 prephenate dehydratase [Pontibacillus litoralis JSM 072002]